MLAFLARRRRRARLDDDHRVGARHPAGEHADRRARRRARARPALPDPRARRPLATWSRTRTSSIPTRSELTAGGARAARDARRPHRARRRLRDRDARPRDPRRRRPARRRAVRPRRRARVRALRRDARRGGRRAVGPAPPVARGPCASTRASTPTCRRRTSLRGAEDRPAPAARARPSPRTSCASCRRRPRTATARCPSRSRTCSRSRRRS